MKKKRVLKDELYEMVFSSGRVVINRNDGLNFFEIGENITTDVGEAVSIMIISGISIDDAIWKVELSDYDLDVIPERSLFWLTGGHREWDIMNRYNGQWSDFYSVFQEEFGDLVIDGINSSKTFGDIRDYFLKYLNLAILYDFAVKMKFIK